MKLMDLNIHLCKVMGHFIRFRIFILMEILKRFAHIMQIRLHLKRIWNPIRPNRLNILKVHFTVLKERIIRETMETDLHITLMMRIKK